MASPRAELKAAYTIAELAEMSGLDRKRIYRMVTAGKLQTIRLPGVSMLVPLLELRRLNPGFYYSILERMNLAAGTPIGGEVCGTEGEAPGKV